MSEFLYVIAVGVPVSTAICLIAAAARRQFNLVRGGLPVLAATALFGLLLVALFN